QTAHLFVHRRGNGGVGVTERGDRQPSQKVEVPVAVGVDQPAPLTFDEGDRGPAIGLHQHPGLAVGQGHGSTIVPMPSEVNTSSKTACWTRPSRMWAWETPPSMAAATDFSLGTIPPLMSSSKPLRSPRF